MFGRSVPGKKEQEIGHSENFYDAHDHGMKHSAIKFASIDEKETENSGSDITEAENNKRIKLSGVNKLRRKVNAPNLTNAEQRQNSKMKRLQAENDKLKERLNKMEMLIREFDIDKNQKRDVGMETLLNNNRFAVISSENQLEMEDEEIRNNMEINSNTNAVTTINNNETQQQQNAMKKNNKPEQTHTAKTNGERKTSKPPPLHIHKQNIKDTIQLVKGAGIKEFEIRRVNNEKHSLISKNMDEYEKIKTVFKEVNTNFFTYTPKELKPKVIVLKGLNEDEDIAELKATIETHDNIKVLNVMQMKTNRSTAKIFKLPLYLIYCTPDTDLSQIYKIKVLNYQRVTWENLRKRNEITQCRKCQRFGHSASNCNLEYRCVKCNEHHDPGECKTKERTENEKIFCVNCNQMGHPASFKGCTIYQNALQRLKLKIKDKQQQKLPKTFQSIPVNAKNRSYDDMLKQNHNEQMTVSKIGNESRENGANNKSAK